jgi:UDP-N-acetylglucosamine 2-epimerase (non-hydrolysing)
MGLTAGGYGVLTLHRPSNVDDPATLRELLAPILELAERMPVVFPVHPRTRGVLRDIGVREDGGLRLLEPIGYLEFLGLMAKARVVLTDSGGIQEETTVLGVPCVTLRENTERPVTIREGTNVLAGIRPEGVRQAIRKALDAPAAGRVPELWDGRAAERIVEVLARTLVR